MPKNAQTTAQLHSSHTLVGFLGGSDGKASTCNAGDLDSIPVLGRFPWRRIWQPTSVLSPGKSHGWRSLVGCSPWGCKKSEKTQQLHFTSHASKVKLKILRARLQQYMNHEPPNVQAGFRKGRGTREQIANICWIIEKARDFQKNICFCFIDYAKAFDCVDHNKLWKILKEMGIPDHLICLLRNLYAGQEATVRTAHGTTDWFQIGKGVHQGCILLPCLNYLTSIQSTS